MVDGLTFGVLGPLEVRWHGELCRVGRPKSRRLLATLLLHPNRFVATELLVDVLWGDDRPRSAAANLRTYVHELRDFFVATTGESPIRTHNGGYSVEVAPEALDAQRFSTAVAEVEHRRSDGDESGALRVAEATSALWRGYPLDDLPVAPAWQVPLDRLERTRGELLDTLAELWMRCGRHQRACGLLRERIDQEHYAEPLWAKYITSLAASGQWAEARSAAREIRELLAEELGTEPGVELQRIEAQVTDGDETLVASVPTIAAAAGVPQTPSQLPLDVTEFTGRTDELERLERLFTGGGTNRPLVAVLSGPPGVGKTALAVHLGHRLREEFPDGQLFLDMRATSHPRDAAGAIGELLYGLGAPVPADLDRRAATLRSELAGRRVLVLLDDAASAHQVAPLLPGTGSSAMLVTSRQRLSDLTGVVRCAVGELDVADSAALLSGVVGTQRAPLHPKDADAIVQACGRLPLAIRVAGSRLVQRSDLSASRLAERLNDERRRLDELRVGDLAVRASADLSYRMLSAAETRLYHLLGMMGVGELPAWLLNESGVGRDPERVVDALVEANLVQVVGTDAAGWARYRIHDLLRCHAYERALATAPEQARDDLVTVLTLFLERSVSMARRLPFRFLGVTVEDVPARPDDTPVDRAPVDWFGSHRHAHTPLVKAAAAHGADPLGWRLAAAWAPYFDLRAHYEDWSTSHEWGLDCARRAGDGFGEAVLLRNRGQLALYHDDYPAAEHCLGTAYELFAGLPHERGAGVAAVGLGTSRRIAGDCETALHWYEVALEHFLAAGDRSGEAVARNAVGGIRLRNGEPDAAATWLRGALELCLETGDRHREALVRRRVARLCEQQGDRDAALRELRHALDLLTAIGDERCAARVRRSLGPRLADRGDLTTARRMLVAALDVGHRLADARGEAETATRLAQLYEVMGERDSARRCQRRARRAWQQVGEVGVPTTTPVGGRAAT